MRTNRTETVLAEPGSQKAVEAVRCRNCGIPIGALNNSSRHFCSIECRQEFIESGLA